jgi:hypothetical protein
VRRALFVALGLLLLGLTAATASSFTTTTEDVATFSTPVSISVPPYALPPVLYVRGSAPGGFGDLDLIEPEGNDAVTRWELELDDDTLQGQSDPNRYLTWRTPPAPSGGFSLRGSVRLLIDQSGSGEDRLTAGLLSCPAAEAAPSTGCDAIAVAVADPLAGGGQGFKERVASFGHLDVVIAPGHQLRLKIVNRDRDDDGAVVSTRSWVLQWGYLPARQSRLEIAS